MSELINKQNAGADFRWHLLTTVSTFVLLTSASVATNANASGDDSRPTVWIELGGQLERQTGQGDPFSPAYVADFPSSPAFTPESTVHLERPPLYSNGLEGRLLFEPEQTDLVFSASVRYGRSTGHKNTHQGQKIEHPAHFTRQPGGHYVSGQYVFSVPPMGTIVQTAQLSEMAQVAQSQSHSVVDFAVGKDVGLGIFGRHTSSLLNLGVRFAQFTSKTSSTIHARPDAAFGYQTSAFAAYYFGRLFPSLDLPFRNPVAAAFHSFSGSFESQRDFRGIGPSISWNASIPVIGDAHSETLSFDWGVNGAVLFGRQRASVSHETADHYHNRSGDHPVYLPTGAFNRSRTVVVPNIGGLIGASLNFSNSKVSLGYRGDFFFGAMDTGNDERKAKMVGFYGPFATISIGLGG